MHCRKGRAKQGDSHGQREVIERQIDAIDAEIDRLVYGLTEDKIAIVEGKREAE